MQHTSHRYGHADPVLQHRTACMCSGGDRVSIRAPRSRTPVPSGHGQSHRRRPLRRLSPAARGRGLERVGSEANPRTRPTRACGLSITLSEHKTSQRRAAEVHNCIAAGSSSGVPVLFRQQITLSTPNIGQPPNIGQAPPQPTVGHGGTRTGLCGKANWGGASQSTAGATAWSWAQVWHPHVG